jgi:hypothetical protein
MSRRALDRWKRAANIAPGILTGAQRSVLLVIAAYADENGHGCTIGQERMAASAGVSDRAVRMILERLEELGLIGGDPRPGKTTVWSVNLDATPEAKFRAPRKSASTLAAVDPGSTPEVPRKPTSDEGEGEGNTLSPNRPEGRERDGATVYRFRTRRAA